MKKKQHKLSQKEKIEMISKSELYPQKEIQQMFNISRQYFYDIMKEFNIKREYKISLRLRKHTFNRRFFQEINNEQKAYFLGFLCADGAIVSNKSQSRVQLRLIDKEIIENFKKAIDGNMPIEITPESTIKDVHRKENYNIYINSKEMVEDLAKYGVVNNKSYRIFIPENIPNELLRHFLRGYFDGDGCAYTRKNGRCEPTIVSQSYKILEQIKDYLIKNKICDSPTIFNSKNYHTLRFNNNKDSLGFLGFIYENSNIFLTRKKEKYLQFKNKLTS